MVGITFVTHDGRSRIVQAEPGTTLMEAACRNRIEAVYAACGGDGECATCHVYIGHAWNPLTGIASRRERATLRFALETNQNSRLACYIDVTKDMNGLLVHLPERQF